MKRSDPHYIPRPASGTDQQSDQTNLKLSQMPPVMIVMMRMVMILMIVLAMMVILMMVMMLLTNNPILSKTFSD